MNRYKIVFKEIHKKRLCFIPFFTLGDPSPNQSLELIKSVCDLGVDALELGIPFSDPQADGPIIQAANKRALQSKAHFSQCLEILNKIRSRYPDLPIGLLVYANIIYAYGVDNFFQEVKFIDSVVVADVPHRMSAQFFNFSPSVPIIKLVPPSSSMEFLEEIAKESTPFLYMLGRSGVTGNEIQTEESLEDNITALRTLNSPPLIKGFGIKTIEDINKAKKEGVDGVIVGSALVHEIEKDPKNFRVKIIEQIKKYQQHLDFDQK